MEPVRASIWGEPKVGVAPDPNPGLDLLKRRRDRPRHGQSLGREGLGLRAAGEPLQAAELEARGSLTSTVDAPAHSALLALLSARGRRRDQHRGGRTAPGIPIGAGRGAANWEAGSPAPNSTADWLRGETISRPGAAALKGQTPSPKAAEWGLAGW